MRIATTAADPAATAAGRTTASATAAPAATVTEATTTASSPRRERGSTCYDLYTSDEDSNSREDPWEGEPPSESADEHATVLSPCLSCPLSSGSITTLWGPQTPVRWHPQMQTATAETNSLFYSWVPAVGPVHATTPCCGQRNTTSGSAPFKKRIFYGRSQVLASRVQSRPRRSTSNGEVSKAKAMWWTGEVTKPEYVRFCNQIHLFGLQDKDSEDSRKAKQDLLSELVVSKAAN